MESLIPAPNNENNGLASQGDDVHLKTTVPLREGAHLAGGSPGGWDVALGGVVHDHAVGVEAPAEGADGTLHAFDPAAREAVLVALVVEGDEFFAEDAV